MTASVQSLWVGRELSLMERLSVASFVAHGHEYHLYVYDDVTGVPAGAVVRDAAEIVPASRIFTYRHHDSYAGFANLFRYALLFARGGWWADTDVVCLSPLPSASPYVFSSEDDRGHPIVGNCVIRTPPASGAMDYATRECQQRRPEDLIWGETGPRLMASVVDRFGLGGFVAAPEVFCPIAPRDWRRVLDPRFDPRLGAAVCGIHLWNEMWRQAAADKNRRYHPGCLFERLKRRYLEGTETP
jgi:hypothetical protein